MPPQLVFGKRLFAGGRYNSSSIPIPGAAKRSISAVINVESFLDPTVSIEYGVELSLDGGTTWQLLVAGGRPGGTIIRSKTGLPWTDMTVGFSIPPGQGRRLRGFLNVTGGAATLGPATVTVT